MLGARGARAGGGSMPFGILDIIGAASDSQGRQAVRRCSRCGHISCCSRQESTCRRAGLLPSTARDAHEARQRCRKLLQRAVAEGHELGDAVRAVQHY
eukprot:3905340-Alexandrium_andersonii.AAC.1